MSWTIDATIAPTHATTTIAVQVTATTVSLVADGTTYDLTPKAVEALRAALGRAEAIRTSRSS